MKSLSPEFIDITYNAGGSSSEKTLEICKIAQKELNLTTCMHLTCTNVPKSKIDGALGEAKKAGIQNILALRGDQPKDEHDQNDFLYAADLVKYIRAQYGDYFCIGVAGYPENHPDNSDGDLELEYLKNKVDSGADFIITQFFYDADVYFSWVEKCRKIGVKVPIIPGLMLIQNYFSFKRMTSLCKTKIPQHIIDGLELVKDDDVAVKEYGTGVMVQLCNTLLQRENLGFHFYTLNLEKGTSLVLEGLKFCSKDGMADKFSVNLPVKQSQISHPLSKIQNDEFPNGRCVNADN